MFLTSTSMQNGRMRPYRHTGDMPSPAYKPGTGAVINNEEISEGMVLSCLFNEGAGTTVNDKTASPLVGALTDAEMWDFGSAYGNILTFGSGNRIEIPHDSKNNIETYTLAFAIRTSSSATYSCLLVKGAGGFPYPFGFYLGYPSAGKLFAQCGDGPNEPYAETSLSYNDGEWHKIIVTRAQGGALRLYVDGVLRGYSADTTTPNGTLSSADIVIGQDNAHSHQYFGQIAYVHMWDRVLTGAPGSVDNPATGEIAAITADEFLMYR